MNLGAVLVLVKLFQEIGMEAITVGPPAPPPAPYAKVRPTCSPGYFAYQHPRTGFWTCKLIPKGR